MELGYENERLEFKKSVAEVNEAVFQSAQYSTSIRKASCISA
jgi:hypothetical protein